MPVYAYWSQLKLIREQKSIGSFSIYVCAILLISNILRVFFWLTKGFALNLLFQSIFIIIIQVNFEWFSWCYSNSVWSYRITLSNKPTFGGNSGNGKHMKSIVSLLKLSQSFTRPHCWHDNSDSNFPSLHIWIFWIINRNDFNVHWSHSRISSTVVQPHDKEC